MNVSGKLALIALGANLPFGTLQPEGTLRAAVTALAGEGFEIAGLSRLYRTPCYPAGTGPDYVNAAAAIRGGNFSDAASILRALHRTEAFFGRERGQRWGMRTLDLDLLAWGQDVLPDSATQTRWRVLPADSQVRTTPDQLILPHPRLQDRAFVLVPLADIAPEWQHPLTGQTVRQMLDALPEADKAAISPL